VRLALDTNRYVDLCRGDDRVLRLAESAEGVVLPFPVVAELRAGFAAATRAADNERLLRGFLLKPGVEVAYADDQTTRHYAAVFAQLRRQGTPIPTNDLWIAALVLQHGLVLCTRDAHFAHLAQLPRV
jgi:tRNA(fMet)-specific endonuclease VapC